MPDGCRRRVSRSPTSSAGWFPDMNEVARSRPEVLAHVRFAARKAELEGLPHEELFTRIWKTNLWGAETSVSGLGSEDAATRTLRRELPALLERFKVETLLDLPCGDCGWMVQMAVKLRRYIGAGR